MTTTTADAEPTDTPAQRGQAAPQVGGAIYGLGLIGALVWFWRNSEGVGGHIVGVLKAIVWPAFLVYAAFKALRD